MSDLFGGPDLSELIACVKREVDLRRRVYPKRVAAGYMTKDDAAREIDRMRRVLLHLEMARFHEEVATEAKAIVDWYGRMPSMGARPVLDKLQAAIDARDRFERTMAEKAKK
jgi:hypothetical protein